MALQNEDMQTLILENVGEGVAVVDGKGALAWSNTPFKRLSADVVEKVIQMSCQTRHFFERQQGNDGPGCTGEGEAVQLESAGGVSSKSSVYKRLSLDWQGAFYELMISPLHDDNGNVNRVLTILWDATGHYKLQRKVDAIDAAGNELSRIDSEVVKEMTPGERLKLLRDKIITYSKDLMHFDHFAIRLLDKRTKKMEVVIAEGLPPEALEIDLYAEPEGNGISGYVGATGRSYLCHDTEKDTRYVLGLEHCKSSLTVPLKLFDNVIGVFNVESVSVGAFNEDDRQFAEIFGRYVAMALNILDLLLVERCTITGQLANNVVQELARPLGDICKDMDDLMEACRDEDLRNQLSKMSQRVESVRCSIKDVAAGPKAVLGVEDEDQDSPDDGIRGREILIADDEKNIRNTIRDVLTRKGCICRVARDGFEAVTLLGQHSFDLIISDIKMPYRNGYEIFAAAKRIDADLPVILMTGFGYDPNHSVVRASQEGLSAVLFKPFKLGQLMDEVKKGLGVVAAADCAG